MADIVQYYGTGRRKKSIARVRLLPGEGTITINGKKFDSSRGGVPFACRLCDLIEGWIIAMQQMHIGDKWEIYVPAEMGYGKFSQPGIHGGSTLIFEIELFGIG